MNKKFYYRSVLFLIITATNCFAQDTIFMQNDQRIPCNVVEVTATEVKYKKWELIDGPLYIQNKSAVTQIKYKNGFVDVFPEVKSSSVQPAKDPKRDKLMMVTNNFYMYGDKRLNEKGMQQLLLSLNDPQITKEVKRAKRDKRLKYIGFLAIPLAIGAVVSAEAYYGPTYNNEPTTVRNEEFVAPAVICTIGALKAFTASIYFGIDRKARNARAVRLYQEKYEGK
jgi:hypothetical protein